MRRLIKPNGNTADVIEPLPWDQMKLHVCGNQNSLAEMVRLHRFPAGMEAPKEPHVMFCDEEGSTDWHPGYPLPENPEATKFYHANCKPGTVWPIRGTVYICPLGDYE
jgi:hypothetical protein